ncbi:MAG: M12 family metallo-peptidase [Chlorobi bacterium]|nr:M12 family metallo-peptidase [Chlorobiota bacterium]
MNRVLVLLMTTIAIASAAEQERVSAQLFLHRLSHTLDAGTDALGVDRTVLRAVAALPARTIEIADFPIGIGQTGTLRLDRKRSIADGQTQWWVAIRAPREGEPAQLRPLSGPTQYSLAGEITQEPGSHVWLSIVDGQLYAIVQRSNGTVFSIEPIGTTDGNADVHVMTSSTRTDNLWRWVCSAAELPEYTNQQLPPPSGNEILQYSPLLQARVAVETTTSLYQRLGRSTDRVASYVAAVFSMVSRLYEDEVNITFTLSWVMIWTEPPNGEEDPYQNDTDISALLTEVSQFWNRNWTSVPRDVVHVMTAPSSTDVGGIARLASLCNRNSAYSVSGVRATYTYPTLEYTWDVMVVAHEIGHVFGARHTHDCYWAPPLDTCVTQDGNPPIGDACYRSPVRPRPSWNGGSIMSYCHLVQQAVTMTFRPQVANIVRNSIAQSCLRQPSSPLLLLQYPIGNQQLVGGTPVEIRWTSAQVQTVSIEYSNDSLRTWTRIATSIPASNRTYTWTLPNQNLPTVWVRIFDQSNPTIGDTTAAKIAIVIPALELTAPVGGERYGFGERVTISWTRTLVTNVRLLSSLDGGTRWDTLVANTSSQQYQWTIPAQATDRAVVRIESTDDPSVYSQSRPFAIGQPQMQLLSPNGGERWAAGSVQKIRWQSDFVNRIRMDYSTDAGRSWRTIQFSYDATQQQMDWQVPNTPTDSAIVRLRYAADPTIATQSHSMFSITVSSGTQSVTESPAPVVMLLTNLIDGEHLWLKVIAPVPIPSLTVTLINMLGQPIVTMSDQWVPSGETVLTVPVPSEMITGAYILTVHNGTTRWAFPLVRMQR